MSFKSINLWYADFTLTKTKKKPLKCAAIRHDWSCHYSSHTLRAGQQFITFGASNSSLDFPNQHVFYCKQAYWCTGNAGHSVFCVCVRGFIIWSDANLKSHNYPVKADGDAMCFREDTWLSKIPGQLWKRGVLRAWWFLAIINITFRCCWHMRGILRL